MTHLEIRSLSKFFGNTRAVDGVSITVESGKFCALVGTSGCGKSTTLRMINRLIEPTSGEILIDNTDVRRFPLEKLRRGIGYAIQGIGLFPHRTVAENIGTIPSLLGWPRARVSRRVGEMLELVRLDGHALERKYPHQLSGGQQQRVGVARALAGQPSLLLMDEPFGALDPITRETLQDELLTIQRELGITAVLVTHDMDEAIKLCDHIAVMDKGQIVRCDSTRALLENPGEAFVSELVGKEDRSFKILSLLTVGEAMGPIGKGDRPSSESTSPPRLRTTDNLRHALSELLLHGHTQQLVENEDGVPVGQLGVNNVVDHMASVGAVRW